MEQLNPPIDVAGILDLTWVSLLESLSGNVDNEMRALEEEKHAEAE